MRVLVTGADGMLGRDVVAAARAAGWECVALDRAALDITDCAAWTDVDGAEADEPAALAVNGDGAGNLAWAAVANGARLVHVSSDYVFDGTAARPYLESDPTGPQSAYGRTKLAGEHAVLGAGPQNAVVRTAWLFGPGGRNFVATILERAAGGQRDFVVVDDQIGCPTYTGHLAAKLLEVAQDGLGGIIHAAGAGRCSWNDFARAVVDSAGLAATVSATTTAALARPARRPAWSVLGSERGGAPLPSWREGLDAYLGLAGAPR
jgi:dTDP-4-dehydrorhamnose reductase